MKAQAATIKAQTARIDAFKQQAAEIAMLKRQMSELHVAVLAARPSEAFTLAVVR
ncbi:MAG: hypothetical protein IPI73_17745 [Betaproteobacteria bacterium]|nr:hypothetical protein [Betaproteobacteria bacterium]